MKSGKPTGKPGYVYVFTSPSISGWVKIGRASDWEKRLRVFQTYVPEDYVPVCTLRTANMISTERFLHSIIGNIISRKKEFYPLTPEQATRILTDVAREKGELSGLVKYGPDGLPTAEYNSFGEIVKPMFNPSIRSIIFHAAKKGTDIRMRVSNATTFIVLKGSLLDAKTKNLLDSKSRSIASIRAERERLEGDCSKVAGGRLLCDIPFKSPSRALAVMLGCSSMQGPEYWIDQDGKPLRSYFTK